MLGWDFDWNLLALAATIALCGLVPAAMAYRAGFAGHGRPSGPDSPCTGNWPAQWESFRASSTTLSGRSGSKL